MLNKEIIINNDYNININTNLEINDNLSNYSYDVSNIIMSSSNIGLNELLSDNSLNNISNFINDNSLNIQTNEIFSDDSKSNISECIICLDFESDSDIDIISNDNSESSSKCLIDMSESNNIFLKNCLCKYYAHESCIKEWLQNKPSCPLCTKPLILNNRCNISNINNLPFNRRILIYDIEDLHNQISNSESYNEDINHIQRDINNPHRDINNPHRDINNIHVLVSRRQLIRSDYIICISIIISLLAISVITLMFLI